MKKKLRSQLGFTLIEILAATLILSMVVILSLSIFPLMANWNNKNAENLDTVNIGKEILVKMKNKEYSQLENKTNNQLNDVLPINVTSSKFDPSLKTLLINGTYEYYNNKFYIDILISSEIEEGTEFLRKMKIDIKDSKNTILTTTYGYLQR